MLKVELGDITTYAVDAIVNAANTSLLGGGGVDGAIHRAAGPELLEECRTLNGCETGKAKLTRGYKLPAEYVIHTVGPIWKGGGLGERQLLKSCYLNCLMLAEENKLHKVAFPSISTGAYHFPVNEAAEIAICTIMDFLKTAKSIREVIIVCFDKQTYDVYRRTYENEK